MMTLVNVIKEEGSYEGMKWNAQDRVKITSMFGSYVIWI